MVLLLADRLAKMVGRSGRKFSLCGSSERLLVGNGLRDGFAVRLVQRASHSRPFHRKMSEADMAFSQGRFTGGPYCGARTDAGYARSHNTSDSLACAFRSSLLGQEHTSSAGGFPILLRESVSARCNMARTRNGGKESKGGARIEEEEAVVQVCKGNIEGGTMSPRVCVGWLALALLIGCSLLGVGRDSITVGVAAPVVTMNPHGDASAANLSMMSNIFSALVTRAPDGSLAPALALSWESVDAYTWRFWLREGVVFHNGNPFTWEDVAYSFERLQQPYPISDGTFVTLTERIIEVVPVDGNPWIIDIKLSIPNPVFIETLNQYCIMDRESTMGVDPGVVAANPNGTGPYEVTEWIRGSHVTLKAFDRFWGGAPAIENVVVKELTEASTRVAALLSGEVGFIQDVPAELYDMVAATEDVEIQVTPDRRYIHMGMKDEEGFPTNDIRVRMAIAMAIDIDELIEKVLFGRAYPITQIVDPAVLGFDPGIERFPYNPVEAKRLLADAGYPDGFEIELATTNNRDPRDSEIGQGIVGQLAKVGIMANLTTWPSALYYAEHVGVHKAELYIMGYTSNSFDSTRIFTSCIHTPDESSGGYNGGNYSDPALDRLIEAADYLTDPDFRGQLQRLTMNIAMKEKVTLIPLYTSQKSYAMKKALNIQFTPLATGWLDFSTLSFREG